MTWLIVCVRNMNLTSEALTKILIKKALWSISTSYRRICNVTVIRASWGQHHNDLCVLLLSKVQLNHYQVLFLESSSQKYWSLGYSTARNILPFSNQVLSLLPKEQAQSLYAYGGIWCELELRMRGTLASTAAAQAANAWLHPVTMPESVMEKYSSSRTTGKT